MRPSVSIGPQTRRIIAAQVVDASYQRIRADADRLGQSMVDHGTNIIRAELVTDRPPARRRSKGGRLVNALKYVVTDGGRYPLTVALTIKPGVSAVKAIVQNTGAKPHVIRAKHHLVRGKPMLVFPNVRGTASAPRKGTARQRQVRSAYGTRDVVITPSVKHPGNKGINYMSRAREAAIREFLARRR